MKMKIIFVLGGQFNRETSGCQDKNENGFHFHHERSISTRGLNKTTPTNSFIINRMETQRPFSSQRWPVVKFPKIGGLHHLCKQQEV